MNILLIYTNRDNYLAPQPIGLAYLAAPLKRKGHNIKLLDLMFSKNPHRELNNTIDEFKPDIVAFSIRNLDNQYMLDLRNPLPEIKNYVELSRSKGLTTVLGGTAFTTFPKEMLEYMNADYGISGQGEESFPLLVEAIANDKHETRIPGLVWWEGDSVRTNPPIIVGYVNSQADWSLLNLHKYRRTYWPACVVIKTGCPYKCAYCDAKTTFGDRFIFRHIEAIIDDIRTIQRTHGISVFHLSDPCFNSPLDWAKEVLRAIIRENLKIYFNTTVVPIHGCYDDEFFELYTKAGGIFTILGAESFSQTMLENYRKPFSIEDVYNCSKLANKHGLTFGVELLFGGPGENAKTIIESMAFLPKINYSLFLFGIGIRILPNTEIFDIAKREGIVNDSSELLFPKFYVSPELDMDWARKYIQKSLRRYSYRGIKMIPFGLRSLFARYLSVIV